MTERARRERWNRVYDAAPDKEIRAATVLREQSWLLPRAGQALDLACGRGGNAILLARHGLRVHAWDIADAAVAGLRRLCEREVLDILIQRRDVCARPPAESSFDVIAASRFLHRPLLPSLAAALRPRGLLFYQTFTEEKTAAAGPTNPDYLLRPNELLRAFSALRVLYYLEAGRVGDTTQGHRDEAMLVAQRRG